MLSLTYTYADGQTFSASIAETATAAAQTACIQKALTAVGVHGGGTVTLSAGTWTVAGTGKAADGCLSVGSDTTLQGAGTGATVLKLAAGSTATTGIVHTDSGRLKADGTYTTADKVSIKALSLDGNAANTTGSVDGFYCGPKPGTAQADTNITLDHVEIMNCSRYGFDPHERTVGLTFAACVAHHNGVDGFTIDFCSNVTLTDNLAYANGRHGFNLVTGTNHVTMTGNTAHHNGGSGIAIQTGDNEIRGTTEWVQITGGVLADNGRYGLEVRQANQISADGITVIGNALEGIRLDGVQNAALTGNVSSTGAALVRVGGYLQDFNDTDPLNDRWVMTTGVVVDGVVQANPVIPAGALLWTYAVGDGNDVITGSAGRDAIAAGNGNDLVFGNAGNDSLYGNDGNDTLDGGAGRDQLFGGAGNDQLRFSGGAGDGVDVLDGGAGRDSADFRNATAEVVVNLGGGGIEASIGGVGVADLINIEDVSGSRYGDVLTGDANSNRLKGANGADRIDGGAGNDIITGGRDADMLTGGAGADVFHFNGGDGIDGVTDFVHGSDRIELAGFSGGLAGLAISQVGADTRIGYGADAIWLTGVDASTLGVGDFRFI